METKQQQHRDRKTGSYWLFDLNVLKVQSIFVRGKSIFAFENTSPSFF